MKKAYKLFINDIYSGVISGYSHEVLKKHESLKTIFIKDDRNYLIYNTNCKEVEVIDIEENKEDIRLFKVVITKLG